MISTKSFKSPDFIELTLVNHEFTSEEYLVVKKSLKMYTPGIWIPIGLEVFSPDIQNQKRSDYEEVSQLFEEYSPEWAFSPQEIDIIKKALNHFISLPLPLYDDSQFIIFRKKEREIAKQIASFLP